MIQHKRWIFAASALLGICLAAPTRGMAEGSGGGNGTHKSEASGADKTQNATPSGTRVSRARQVSGTVLDTKVVRFKGTNEKNTVALLRTNKSDERLTVDLGPVDQTKAIHVHKGQELSAEGVVVQVGSQSLLVASRVKSGDKVFQIDRLEQLERIRKAGSSSEAGRDSPKQR